MQKEKEDRKTKLATGRPKHGKESSECSALHPASRDCEDTIWMSTALSSHHSLWPSHFQVPWSLSLVGVIHCLQDSSDNPCSHYGANPEGLTATWAQTLQLHWLIAHSQAPWHKRDPATYWLTTQTFNWNLMQGPMIKILKFGVPGKKKTNILWIISMIANCAVSVRGNQSPLDQGCRSVWVPFWVPL